MSLANDKKDKNSVSADSVYKSFCCTLVCRQHLKNDVVAKESSALFYFLRNYARSKGCKEVATSVSTNCCEGNTITVNQGAPKLLDTGNRQSSVHLYCCIFKYFYIFFSSASICSYSVCLLTYHLLSTGDNCLVSYYPWQWRGKCEFFYWN
jgi:hypothetical protein